MTNRGHDAKVERLTGLGGAADARRWVASRRDAVAALTVVVDTVGATLELDDILLELADFDVALELDPAGYLFSYIKTFSDEPGRILPDRADITLSTHCLQSYVRHAIHVAGQRGATVRGEIGQETPAQTSAGAAVAAVDLLQVPSGRITEQGVRRNIRLSAKFLAGEEIDASEAELARAQLWQCVHHETGILDSGGIITPALFSAWLSEERECLRADSAGPDTMDQAVMRLEALTLADELAPEVA